MSIPVPGNGLVFKVELQFQTQMTQEESLYGCGSSPESHGPVETMPLFEILFPTPNPQGLNSCIHKSSNIQLPPGFPPSHFLRDECPETCCPLSHGLFICPMHLCRQVSWTRHTVLQYHRALLKSTACPIGHLTDNWYSLCTLHLSYICLPFIY